MIIGLGFSTPLNFVQIRILNVCLFSNHIKDYIASPKARKLISTYCPVLLQNVFLLSTLVGGNRALPAPVQNHPFTLMG